MLQNTGDADEDVSDLKSLSSAESSQSEEEEEHEVSDKAPRILIVLQQASKQISLLFELSNLLEKSTVEGRWIRSTGKPESILSETFAQYDLLHVEEKVRFWRGLGKDSIAIPTKEEAVAAHAEEMSESQSWLHYRLSQANTKRRAQLQYWAKHPYGSLGALHTLPPEKTEPVSRDEIVVQERPTQITGKDDASTVKPKTVTGSVHQSQPSVGTKHTFSTVAASDAIDGATQAERPRTIYAPSAGGVRQVNRVPTAPCPSEKGEVFCPYCGIELRSQTVEVRDKWK